MKLNISSVIATALLACAGIEAKLSSTQQHDLLKLHENARSSLNAPDMKSISWDDSLAAAAQSYSAQCKGMVHSGVGGENLAGSTTGDVTRMFENWMKEKSAFDKSGYRSKFLDIKYNGEDVGHYSQIVWAANTKVGCGLSYCENFSAKYLLVCRYGTGNVLYQQVYGSGSASKSEKEEEKKSSSDDDHHHEEKKTTTTHAATTTTHKATTTEAHKETSSSHEDKKEEEKKEEEKKEEEKKENEDKKEDEEKKENEDKKEEEKKEEDKETENDTPSVDSTVVSGNSTVTNDDKKSVENDDGTIVKPDGTVETKNINENYKKDGIIDQVGPSSYEDSTGTIITGVAISGSVLGAAAAFAFYKRNPKQYKQLTENVKNIQRGITRKATSVKRSATAVTRKFTTRQNSSSNLQKRTPTSLDSSDCSIDTSSDYNIDNMPMMTEMAELPESKTNYRKDFTQSFDI